MNRPTRLAQLIFAAGVTTLAACQHTDTVDVQATAKGAQDPADFSKPPAWAKQAVWYQIFAERFNNGDRRNDPTVADIAAGQDNPVPPGWQITPWTQDWYQPDDYFANIPGDGFNHKTAYRRYGGDLQGVHNKLDYLQSLGVNAIYFNPLNDAPSLHKYDARNWHHIDRNFGPTPEQDKQLMATENPADPATWVMTGADKQFVQLVEEIHRRGMRVILDFSWNHTGRSFWAWQDVLENQAESEFADWYWVKSFDDPATEQNEFDYRGWFGVPSLPEIKETTYVTHAEKIEPFEGDIANEAAKQHILAVTKRWLDPNGDGDLSDGVDGFRLDVAAEVPLGFWRDYRKFVRNINPEALLIGEVWWEQFPDDLLDPAPYLQGDIFDSVMNYRWYREARRFFADSPQAITPSDFVSRLEGLMSNLDHSNNYAMMNMTASHDSPRLSTSLFNKSKYKVGASAEQNPQYKIHKPDAATYNAVRLLLAHQYTYVGAPQIWAGDEMGMWGTDDPHTRKPLIWPELQFDDEKAHPLNLQRPADQVAFDQDLFTYYQKVIGIRNQYPVLAQGDLSFILADDNNELLAYSRFDQQQEVIAVFNKGDKTQQVSLPARLPGAYADVLNALKVSRSGEQLLLTLDPQSAAILAPTYTM